MPAETFKARIGHIMVKDTEVILEKDGQRFVWPPQFDDSTPRFDTIDNDGLAKLKAEGRTRDKYLSKVIKAILKRNPNYKRHPVIQRWIEHNKQTIAILRRAGFPFHDGRLQIAEDRLIKVAGRKAVVAAKKPYKKIDKLSASREAELRKAAAPIHAAWWESTKDYPSSEKKRKEYVIKKFIPSGKTPMTPYDETLKLEIENWIDIFEGQCLTWSGKRPRQPSTSFAKAVHFRLEKGFGERVNLSHVRRGRQLIKKTNKEG